MSPTISSVILLVLCSLHTALCQDTSYDPGPYKRVYPPANLSLEQQSCEPDATTNHTCPLYVALMMSFGGAFASSGVIPAVEVALDQINADPNMLPRYTLHYTLKDSQCSRTVALDSLHTEIIQPPTKIAVLGSGCSVATEPTAKLSHYYNITQLSCVSSSTELTNRERFPRHFQLSTAEINFAYGFFGVIQTFRWRRVSIIIQNENLFTVTMAELKRLLSATNVTFTETRFGTDTGIDINPFTEDPDGRIFILSMYADYAREILCMAYSVSSSFRYPQYLFFVNGWYNDRWWVGSEEEQAELVRKYNCDAAQRESLLPSTLAPATSDGLTVLNYSATSDNGHTGDEVRSAFEEALEASPFNLTELFLYQLCYDATWILARALNDTLNDLSGTEMQERLRQQDFLGSTVGGDFGLQHFTYDNNVILENIFSQLTETTYRGVAGNISFDSNGGRHVDTVELLQYRINSAGVLRAVPVASVVRQSEFQYTLIYLEENGSLWTDGVPYDGVPTESIVTVQVSITVIFSILATCGIAFATVCILLNTYFRKKKVIQLTSPNLNTIIGVGAIVLYFNMYLFVIPTTNKTAISVLCNLDTWLTAIGYSLCYGTILAKMCRVYYIFHNPGLKKKTIKDWFLALFVLSLIIVDLVILLSYTISQGVLGNLTAERVPNKEHPEDRVGVLGEIFRYYTYICLTRQRHITLGVLYGYKALLQVIALILAISIRKVQIKGLNDAKYIISAIYVTSIVTTVIVVSTYTLTELIDVYAAVFCICFFVGTTAILGLVFMPPLIGLYRDPEGDGVFKDSTAKSGAHNAENQLNLTAVEESSVSLRKRVRHLEEELEQMKMENAKLKSDDGKSQVEKTGSKLFVNSV